MDYREIRGALQEKCGNLCISFIYGSSRTPESVPRILVNARLVFYNQHTDESIGNERRVLRGEGLF